MRITIGESDYLHFYSDFVVKLLVLQRTESDFQILSISDGSQDSGGLQIFRSIELEVPKESKKTLLMILDILAEYEGFLDEHSPDR